MANVKFCTVDLKQKFLDLVQKDIYTLYYIEDTQELYKGSKLFGTGAEATYLASGLLSAEDYTKLQNLVSGIGLESAAPGQIPYMGVTGKLVWSSLSLRRDNITNYQSDFVPQNGEVCLVDTEHYGLRTKIGDGFTSFDDLKFIDNENNIIQLGYFLNEKFYTDSTYTVELEKEEKHLYIDKNSKGSAYIWNGEKFEPLSPEATENVAGMMKLYQTHGQNTDGTMSQKAITDGVNSIKFAIETMPDEDGDGIEENCLVLDLPWD